MIMMSPGRAADQVISEDCTTSIVTGACHTACTHHGIPGIGPELPLRLLAGLLKEHEPAADGEGRGRNGAGGGQREGRLGAVRGLYAHDWEDGPAPLLVVTGFLRWEGWTSIDFRLRKAAWPSAVVPVLRLRRRRPSIPKHPGPQRCIPGVMPLPKVSTRKLGKRHRRRQRQPPSHRRLCERGNLSTGPAAIGTDLSRSSRCRDSMLGELECVWGGGEGQEELRGLDCSRRCGSTTAIESQEVQGSASKRQCASRASRWRHAAHSASINSVHVCVMLTRLVR